MGAPDESARESMIRWLRSFFRHRGRIWIRVRGRVREVEKVSFLLLIYGCSRVTAPLPAPYTTIQINGLGPVLQCPCDPAPMLEPGWRSWRCWAPDGFFWETPDSVTTFEPRTPLRD